MRTNLDHTPPVRALITPFSQDPSSELRDYVALTYAANSTHPLLTGYFCRVGYDDDGSPRHWTVFRDRSPSERVVIQGGKGVPPWDGSPVHPELLAASKELLAAGCDPAADADWQKLAARHVGVRRVLFYKYIREQTAAAVLRASALISAPPLGSAH